MTQTQKVQLRQSEVRQKLNELLGVESRTDGTNGGTWERSRLRRKGWKSSTARPWWRNRRPTMTPRGHRPAIPKTRERHRDPQTGRGWRDFMDAAISGRAVDGAEAEGRRGLRVSRRGAVGDVRDTRASAGRARGDAIPCQPRRRALARLCRRCSSGPRRRGSAWTCRPSPRAMPGSQWSARPLPGASRRSPPSRPKPKARSRSPRRSRGGSPEPSGSRGRMPPDCPAWNRALRENLSSVLSDAADGQAVNGSGDWRRHDQRSDRDPDGSGRARGRTWRTSPATTRRCCRTWTACSQPTGPACGRYSARQPTSTRPACSPGRHRKSRRWTT